MITTITTVAGTGGRRRHLAILRSTFDRSWVLQWATATQNGHSYEPPLGGVRYPTRKAAEAAKRALKEPPHAE